MSKGDKGDDPFLSGTLHNHDERHSRIAGGLGRPLPRQNRTPGTRCHSPNDLWHNQSTVNAHVDGETEIIVRNGVSASLLQYASDSFVCEPRVRAAGTRIDLPTFPAVGSLSQPRNTLPTDSHNSSSSQGQSAG